MESAHECGMASPQADCMPEGGIQAKLPPAKSKSKKNLSRIKSTGSKSEVRIMTEAHQKELEAQRVHFGNIQQLKDAEIVKKDAEIVKRDAEIFQRDATIASLCDEISRQKAENEVLRHQHHDPRDHAHAEQQQGHTSWRGMPEGSSSRAPRERMHPAVALPFPHRDDLPCGMRDVTDGVMVSLDHSGPSVPPAVGRSAAENMHCYNGARYQDTPVTSAFVSVMHTNILATQLREAMPEGSEPKEATITIPIDQDFSEDKRGGGYSHIVLRARNVPLEGGSCLAERITSVAIDFVPMPVEDWQSLEQENGDIAQEHGQDCSKQQITREYMLAIRTHASNIREPHNVAGNDCMYVHGMRKVVSHIGWNLCRTPVCNVHLPIVPASITMDDCIRVLQAMRFEVGVPAREEDRVMPEGEKVGWEPLYVLVRRAHQVRDRITEEVPILELPMAVPSPEALAAALAESAQQAIFITKKRSLSDAPHRIGGRPPPLTAEEAEAEMMGANEHGQCHEIAQGKLSVYTVGTLNTRQMFLVPCSARIINFMKECMPETFTRDLAGRMVLGAYNALSTERHLGCINCGTGAGMRTRFLEDIECPETQRYAEHITAVLQAHMAHKNCSTPGIPAYVQGDIEAAHACDMTGLEASMGARQTLPLTPTGKGLGRDNNRNQDYRGRRGKIEEESLKTNGGGIYTISTKWCRIPVIVYAVRLDMPSAPMHKQQQEETPKRGALYAFAFCTEGRAQPFALTGMRYLFYPFISVAPAQAYGEPELGRGRHEAEQADMGIHSCPVSRGQMVEDLVREVCPVASSLNYRQRFALQQSFILQACSIHKQGLGPHKYMLRNLALEWYVRRVKRNHIATASGVDGSGETIEGGRPHVTDEDLTFMIASMQKLKREINPHWWFAASIF